MATHCSDSRSPKCAKNEPEDRISQLPDCILALILSHLPLRQAGATSILSKSWEQLWLSIYRKLEFDSSQFDGLTPKDFVGRVNEALASHRAEEIDELRIRCGLDESFEKVIDEWLNFAFAKKVKRLELDLSSGCNGLDLPCRFPGGLLKLPGSLGIPSWLLQSTGDRDGSFKFDFNNLRFLTSLSLYGLNVTTMILGHILNSFCFLEQLKVCYSKVLSHCSVDSSSRALRHLEITNCTGLEYLNLCDAQCLISLKVTKVTKLVIENAPNLVNISLLGFCWDVAQIIPQISRARIEILTLEAYYSDLKEVKEFSQLFELKQFNFTVLNLPNKTHTRLVSLIRSLPELKKFVLKLLWTRKARRVKRTFDLRSELPLMYSLDSYPPWNEEKAEEFAELLEGALPASVEFNIV